MNTHLQYTGGIFTQQKEQILLIHLYTIILECYKRRCEIGLSNITWFIFGNNINMT